MDAVNKHRSRSPRSLPARLASETNEPWVASDTWYRLHVGGSDVQCYLNARTGVSQKTQPDGFRNGCKLRSAASEGSWAVPGDPPLVHLPVELAPIDVDTLAPAEETWGDGDGPLFSAPHGVGLNRDGKAPHLPEDFTTFIARMSAALCTGRSITWGARALELSDLTEKPLPGARDPNYMLEDELVRHPWALILKSKPHRGLHFDIHGKRDRPGEADIDVGVGACRQRFGDDMADTLAERVHSSLVIVASAYGFSVDPLPRLQGAWKTVPRVSFTQAASSCGYTTVQLELGYQARKAIARDLAFCRSFALALASVALRYR